ncbi:hypothetical protein GQX74_011128 [Glossina fuscipes]|nr:hypothetical protein GQX74_011128 [Glossina fuscipes]
MIAYGSMHNPEPPGPSSSSNSSKQSADHKTKKKSKACSKIFSQWLIVFGCKSGRILTGVSAPTTLNLKKCLQDNPTFEVVQPGSSKALDIYRYIDNFVVFYERQKYERSFLRFTNEISRETMYKSQSDLLVNIQNM